MSDLHSVLPPSGAARWVQCEGSVELCKGVVEVDGPEAAEGDAAHEVAKNRLLFGFLAPVDTAASNGVFITNEMIEATQLYAGHVMARLTPMLWPEHLHVEEKLAISNIHPLCWGTPDGWALVGNVLHIWDLKFGHLFVEVFENWQLLCYLAGILEKLHYVNDEQLTVEFHIVQPRAYHRDGPIRSWRFKASDVRGHFNILRHAAAKAIDGSICKTGPECDFCIGRHRCVAAQQAAGKSASIAGEATPFDLTPYQAGVELKRLTDAKQMLDARISGLQVQVEADMRRGAFVPHWQMEQTRSRLDWTVDNEAIRNLGNMYGVNLFQPPKPVTPTQAKTLCRDIEPLLESFADRKPGAMKVVPFDLTKTKALFSHGK